MKLTKWIFLCVSLFVCVTLQAQPSPLPILEGAANKILATLAQHKAQLKNTHSIIHQAVKSYLLPIVDVEGMARSVLGRSVWNQASAAEKQQFMQAFTQLVIRTYASPLAEYTDEKITFAPIRGNIDGRFIRVNSTIVRTHKKDIPLNYSLVYKQSGWKIYDLNIEGVSLLQSFKSQFAQALKNDDLKSLIAQMNKRQAAK